MSEKMIHCSAYRALIAELRQMRISRRLRQADVGSLLGLSADWVGKIEQGELRLDMLRLILLCRIYGVQADELVRRFAAGLPK